MLPVRNALISVSDKSGLQPLAESLCRHNVVLYASGGTLRALQQMGFPVRSIQEITHNPEILGGRVKTISYQLAASLLFRRGYLDDEKEVNNRNIPPIDLVVCNLYPFKEQVVERGDLTEDEAVEWIDVGGPTMIRAAAKNYLGVSVLVNPDDYARWIEHFEKRQGMVDLDLRRELAVRAFKYLSDYDNQIYQTLLTRYCVENSRSLCGFRQLRYGENPHQTASFFRDPFFGLGSFECLHEGKELSYNNFYDFDAAWRVLRDLSQIFPGKPAGVVIKHGNPCGLALSIEDIGGLEVLSQAWGCDPKSAFGGILGVNAKLEMRAIKALAGHFYEGIIAPQFEEEVLEELKKKKSIRLLSYQIKNFHAAQEWMQRTCLGGVLSQTEDDVSQDVGHLKLVTKQPFPTEFADLALFGIVLVKHLKSNAIALVGKRGAYYCLAGVGMGQPNRIDCLTRLALPRALEQGWDTKELILVSDAFFPFPDVVEEASRSGIRYIVQPGGSKNDIPVIEACDRLGMAMIFTGRRHFRH